MTTLALAEAVPLAHALVDRVARDHDVRLLFIKGPVAVAQGLRGERVSVDVDALVDPARRQVLAAALPAMGWVDEHPYTSPTVLPMHSLTFRHVKWPCELDLHDRFPGFLADRQDVFERLWETREAVVVAAREIPCPDRAGQALVLALHALRDPYDPGKGGELGGLAARISEQFDSVDLRDLAKLARDLGASDTAAPFLSAVGAPVLAARTSAPADLRAWRLRTQPHASIAGWVDRFRTLPKRQWPGYLWYAAFLSEEELRIDNPGLGAGRQALLHARVRRLRRGLRALPSAVRSVHAVGDQPRRPRTAARVLVVQEILTTYRVPFYRLLAEKLADLGVELALVHGFAPGGRASRGDAASLPWAVTSRNRHLPIPGHRNAAVWQPIPRGLLNSADLVIVEQANRQLVNYRLLVRSLVRGRPRLAFWGHGGDLQSERGPDAWTERFKVRLSRLPHWWFAYTQGVADRIVAQGFPPERVTVVQNAVATPDAAGEVERVPGQCVYIGSLYRAKRLRFLVEAADEIATRRPDFRLVVIGDGEDRPYVEGAAATRPWLDYRGFQSGPAAFDVLRQSSLLLIPGLVGLAVVDSFAAECPVVTVDLPFHSPEIEYLEDDINGVRLAGRITALDYGRAVTDLLGDSERLTRLRQGCRDAATTYTIDAMATNFADGIARALT